MPPKVKLDITDDRETSPVPRRFRLVTKTFMCTRHISFSSRGEDPVNIVFLVISVYNLCQQDRITINWSVLSNLCFPIANSSVHKTYSKCAFYHPFFNLNLLKMALQLNTVKGRDKSECSLYSLHISCIFMPIYLFIYISKYCRKDKLYKSI